MRALVSYVGVLILISAAGCAASTVEESHHDKCKRMRDHLVELRLGDLPGAKDEQIIAGHRAALTNALGDGFVATCDEQINNSNLDCALAARDVSAATQCVAR